MAVRSDTAVGGLKVVSRVSGVPNGADRCFPLGIDEATGDAGDDQRPHQTGAVAHPNRKMRDTLALALVNLASVCWLPGTGNRPQAVRSRADNSFHQPTRPTV